jgi:hypothetical protein
MMIGAERKAGIIKQTGVEQSNLTRNANVEDLSTPNKESPDNVGIVFPEFSGNNEMNKGIYIPKKNLQLQPLKELLEQTASIQLMVKVEGTSNDPMVVALIQKVNEIIDIINAQKNFASNAIKDL